MVVSKGSYIPWLYFRWMNYTGSPWFAKIIGHGTVWRAMLLRNDDRPSHLGDLIHRQIHPIILTEEWLVTNRSQQLHRFYSKHPEFWSRFLTRCALAFGGHEKVHNRGVWCGFSAKHGLCLHLQTVDSCETVNATFWYGCNRSFGSLPWACSDRVCGITANEDAHIP